MEELMAWVQIQYMMRIEVRYIMMSAYRTKRFIETLKGKAAEISKATSVGQKQSDAEVLAEQIAIHEQTPESITELESLKKHGKK